MARNEIALHPILVDEMFSFALDNQHPPYAQSMLEAHKAVPGPILFTAYNSVIGRLIKIFGIEHYRYADNMQLFTYSGVRRGHIVKAVIMYHWIVALVLKHLPPVEPRQGWCRLLRDETGLADTWSATVSIHCRLRSWHIRETEDSWRHTWYHAVVRRPHHECHQDMQLSSSIPSSHSSEYNSRHCKNHGLQYRR